MTPRDWFVYDEAHGELKRKPDREMTLATIRQEFGRPPRGGRLAGRLVHDIAAQYLAAAGPTGSIAVDFLSPTEMDRFLTKRSKKGESLLQRFIYPKGHHNGVLQAIWSPHVFRCDRRYNVNKLFDSHVSRYERGVTFEGPMAYSEQAYCNQDLVRHIRSVCGDIATHLMETERRAVSRMVLYFKLDLDDRLWFLWASCLRVKSKAKAHAIPMSFAPSFSMAKESPEDRPLQNVCASPRGAGATPDALGWPPKVPSDLVACPLCGRDFRGFRLPLALEHVLQYCATQRRREAHQRQHFSVGDVAISPAVLRDSSRLELLRHLRAISPKRFHALARLESVVVGGPGPVFTEEEATAVRAKVAAFGRQLDAVLYEGQSHFQTSTDPFKFTLQVDLPLDAKEVILNVLAAAPYCEQVDELPERSAVIGSVLGRILRTARTMLPRNPGGMGMVQDDTPESDMLVPDDVIEMEAREAAQRRIARAAQRRVSRNDDDDDDDVGPDLDAALALCGLAPREPAGGWDSEDEAGPAVEGRVSQSSNGGFLTRQSSTCSRTSLAMPPSYISLHLSWANGRSLRALRLHFDTLKEVAHTLLQPSQPGLASAAVAPPAPSASPSPSAAGATPPATPAVLRALFPLHKEAALRALCDDRLFVRQTVPLCQMCYLQVSDVLTKDLHRHRRLTLQEGDAGRSPKGEARRQPHRAPRRPGSEE